MLCGECFQFCASFPAPRTQCPKFGNYGSTFPCLLSPFTLLHNHIIDSLDVMDELGTSIEIHVEAKGLANMDTFSLSDPFAVVEKQTDGVWEEVGKSSHTICVDGSTECWSDRKFHIFRAGRTETVWDNLDPKWVRSFTLSSNTLLEDELRVSVYDRDAKTQDLEKHEMIGTAVCFVKEMSIEGSNGKTITLQNSGLKETGSVTLIGELFADDKPYHEITLGKCKFRNTSLFGIFMSKPYVAIYRRRSNNEWAPVFRSKAVKKGETTSFAEELLCTAKIRTPKHGGRCEETPLRIELRSHRSSSEHKLIGAVQMSLGSLRRQVAGKKISLGLAGEAVGELRVTQISLGEHSTHFDFEISFCAE